MTDRTATLVINRTSSYCEACGAGADPDQQAHNTVLSYSEEKEQPCRRVFTRVRSDYSGRRIRDAIMAARPDLEWVGFDE